MAVLVFAQLGNNAMPTEGGQRGSQWLNTCSTQKTGLEINVRAPLYQNHADDDGVDGDGGEDDDDVDDKDRG